MTVDDILAAARSALGTPFVHQGRQAGKGMDCAGLMIHVARQLEVDHSDAGGYARRPSGGLLESMLDAQTGIHRVTGQPQAGDLILMRFLGAPQHLAVCAGDTIVHAYETVGKVCEHNFSPAWRSRVVRVYRFNGVENE
ncbi:MAG: C40 family peptidase [Azonexus sp.]|nr:C40 family peptidase [Azonexus sp.]